MNGDERVLLSVARKESGKGYDVFVRDGTQKSIENALAMAIKCGVPARTM